MVLDYINYFRNFAITHKDLQHNPDSETGDGPVGSMHFTKISSDQVLEALRTGIGFQCLCLELFEIETQSQMVADIKLRATGALMIVDNPESASFEAEQACFTKTEKTLFDLLKKIWQDMLGPNADECHTPFEFFDFDKLSITPVSRVFSGQCGHRLVFSFIPKNSINITEPPEDGTFITPES